MRDNTTVRNINLPLILQIDFASILSWIKDYWYVLGGGLGGAWAFIRLIKKQAPSMLAFIRTSTALEVLDKTIAGRLATLTQKVEYIEARQNSQTDLMQTPIWRTNAK